MIRWFAALALFSASLVASLSGCASLTAPVALSQRDVQAFRIAQASATAALTAADNYILSPGATPATVKKIAAVAHDVRIAFDAAETARTTSAFVAAQNALAALNTELATVPKP